MPQRFEKQNDRKEMAALAVTGWADAAVLIL